MRTIYIDTSGRDASPTVRRYYRSAAMLALRRWERDRPVDGVTIPLLRKINTPPTGTPIQEYVQ